MNEEMIARIRDRIERARRAMELAHNKETIELLEELIGEAEADIRKLEVPNLDPEAVEFILHCPDAHQ